MLSVNAESILMDRRSQMMNGHESDALPEPLALGVCGYHCSKLVTQKVTPTFSFIIPALSFYTEQKLGTISDDIVRVGTGDQTTPPAGMPALPLPIY